MFSAAEALADTSRRNITIEISNKTNDICLIDPKIYYESGHCAVPPQPVVAPGDVELCNFTKSAGACGAVGVLTYDVCQKGSRSITEKMAIMFSVPHSRTMFKNWIGLGIFAKSTPVDEEMYNQMYKGDELNFKRVAPNGSVLIYEGQSFVLMATASPGTQSIMKVEVWGNVFPSCKD